MTGVGKSSLANTLCGDGNTFITSNDINSETDKTEGAFTYLEVDNQSYLTMIIDTPGLGDSEGRDSTHMA